MKVHEEEMFDSNYDNMENLKPVIPEGNSDSASLDNVFELLSMYILKSSNTLSNDAESELPSGITGFKFSMLS